MTVQQTSLDAWRYIQARLSYQQEMILTYLKVVKEANNMMLVQGTGLPINVITARIFELRRKGLVVLGKIDICPKTLRRTMWWRVKE